MFWHCKIRGACVNSRVFNVGDGGEEGRALEHGRADDELGLVELGELSGVACWIELFGFRRDALCGCNWARQGNLAACPGNVYLGDDERQDQHDEARGDGKISDHRQRGIPRRGNRGPPCPSSRRSRCGIHRDLSHEQGDRQEGRHAHDHGADDGLARADDRLEGVEIGHVRHGRNPGLGSNDSRLHVPGHSAPWSIHARRAATCWDANRSPFGGMTRSSSRPAVRRTTKLSFALPGTITGPLSPPLKAAAPPSVCSLRGTHNSAPPGSGGHRGRSRSADQDGVEPLKWSRLTRAVMYSSTRDSSSWELGGEGFARAVMAGSEIARTQPARTRPGRRWITRTIAPRSRDAALVSRPTPRVALELLCRYHLLVIRADESNLATPLPRKSETPGGGAPGVREGTKDVIEMRGPRRGGGASSKQGGSVLVGADDLAASAGDQCDDRQRIDGFLDEVHRAVGEEYVRSAGMERIDLVVAGAVDQADPVTPDAIRRGAAEVGVREGVGPGAAAAIGRIEHAIDGPGGPRGLLPWGSRRSVLALSRIRLLIS